MQRDAIAVLRGRVPENLLPIGTHVQSLFDGYAAGDTAKVIDALQQLLKTGATSADTRREIGELCIQSGRYKEGVDWLQPFVSGGERTTSGYFFPYDNYLLGIASEALGDKQAAAKYYKEMLSYWSNPEIELREIKDAKTRLARLAA
jgi:tetratricopeptide (TPR) repeat protein